nr:MFS transporter [Chitinophagales bacterium]
PIFLRERPGEKFLPWTKGIASSETTKMQLTNWSDIFKSVYSVFTLRNSLLLGIILFVSSLSFNFIATLLPVFTVQALDWTNQEYSQLFAFASLIGGLGGMLIGGILIDKFGKVRMMNIYFFTLIFLTFVFVFGSSMWINSWFIGGFMLAFQILYVFSSIGLFAIAMQCCWKKVSATQFTIYMTLGNLGRIVGAKLIGPAKDQFNWEYTVLLFAAFILVVWIILQFLRINDHLKQVDALDNNNLEKVVSKI